MRGGGRIQEPEDAEVPQCGSWRELGDELIAVLIAVLVHLAAAG